MVDSTCLEPGKLERGIKSLDVKTGCCDQNFFLYPFLSDLRSKQPVFTSGLFFVQKT